MRRPITCFPRRQQGGKGKGKGGKKEKGAKKGRVGRVTSSQAGAALKAATAKQKRQREGEE